MDVRRLEEEDDRSSFSCGDDDLDAFFRRYAGQNQFHHHVGTTYVAVENGSIVGYATVSPGHIEIDRLPAAARKGLPKYPAPVLRLGRLAVDQRAKRRGVGERLLGFVAGLTLQLAEAYGCIGLFVDAKPAAVSYYEQYGFIALPVVEGDQQTRPMPMFLSLATIKSGL